VRKKILKIACQVDDLQWKDYFSPFDDNVIVNAIYSNGFVHSGWTSVMNHFRSCDKRFHNTMFSDIIEDPREYCYQNGEFIFPFKKYLRPKDLKIVGDNILNFKIMETETSPNIYFREYYKNKHGDPKKKKEDKNKK